MACEYFLRFYEKFGANINWLLSGEGEAFVNDNGNRDLLQYKLITIEAKIKTIEIKIANITGDEKKK